MTSAVNFNVTVYGDDVRTYLEGGVLGQGAVKIPLYLVIGQVLQLDGALCQCRVIACTVHSHKISVVDPAFQVNPDPDPNRIQGFDDQKIKKKIQSEFFISFFD
jgi:hypothetical protein